MESFRATWYESRALMIYSYLNNQRNERFSPSHPVQELVSVFPYPSSHRKGEAGWAYLSEQRQLNVHQNLHYHRKIKCSSTAKIYCGAREVTVSQTRERILSRNQQDFSNEILHTQAQNTQRGMPTQKSLRGQPGRVGKALPMENWSAKSVNVGGFSICRHFVKKKITRPVKKERRLQIQRSKLNLQKAT